MSLSTAEIAHVFIALTLLVVAAHVMGYLFARMRQPPVIGEILGGLLFGPTILGAVAPSVAASLLPTSGITDVVLSATYELGLLFLMFLAGGEIRGGPPRRERRTVGMVSLVGLVFPVAAGLAMAGMLDHRDFSGPNGSSLSFALVFGIAIGVTSIPVISRIMLDLGILSTSFARIVLSVAVIEDIVLYVALAVVLGLARASDDDTYGLLALLDPDSTAVVAVGYVGLTVGFFALCLARGPQLFRFLATMRPNLLQRRDPAAFRVAFLLVMALVCVVLGIDPIFGALLAGMCVARGDAMTADGPGDAAGEPGRLAGEAVRRFALAFFVPIYFAIVGLKLDLVRHFDPMFFLWVFLVACAVKAGSVWVGARLSGTDNPTAVNLAVALNARGGPGIVLASVTFAAGVINENFYTTLVLLSIFTSQLAGAWLDRVFVGRRPAPRPAGSRDRAAISEG